jgi:hypothetical protein
MAVTLTKGAAASSTSPISGYLIQQPPFDPRIRSLSRPFQSGSATGASTNIQRGYMAWDPQIPWPKPYSANQSWAGAPKVLFLFNPSTVEASYQISDATAQSALIYPITQVQPILRVPLQQQVGFTIMFDRTYEMNTGGTANVSMKQFGVELDILAMKQFTGMFTDVYPGNNPLLDANGNPVPGNPTNVNPTKLNANGINQGIMQLALSYVYFAAPTNGLRYYGYCDSWDVSYTHFAQNMVPMRAVVDISFTLLPPPGVAGPPTGAATTATNQLTGTGSPPGHFIIP